MLLGTMEYITEFLITLRPFLDQMPRGFMLVNFPDLNAQFGDYIRIGTILGLDVVQFEIVPENGIVYYDYAGNLIATNLGV
jgi:hypothetical protein